MNLAAVLVVFDAMVARGTVGVIGAVFFGEVEADLAVLLVDLADVSVP